ncbi:MAG: hypothetical protein FJ316_11890 [SAR202 cluster bacterium]|nr:hypothetical protein [SAR202 cluster bacterium]
MPRRAGIEYKVATLLTRFSGYFILGVLLATALLALPLFLLPPRGQASQDPGGQVFELQERVNQLFPPRVHITSFIAEDPQGDMLRQAPLWELYQNEVHLRESELAAHLYSGFDSDTGRQINGVFTIADAVQAVLRLDPRRRVSLETASDADVKKAISLVMSTPLGQSLRATLSQEAGSQKAVVDGAEIDYWRSPALFSFVASDNQMLGGGPSGVSLTPNKVTLDKERFNRRVQEILRGGQATYKLWGIAIDVNLTSQEQGRTTMPFIMGALALVLVVVGVSLRSWRCAILALLGLLMLMVWLKGSSNLLGLKSSLVVDLLVPIAMISLGVDFFVHTVHRYQEERAGAVTKNDLPVITAALAGVLGAATLALLTDGIAFLANTFSRIEMVVQFGIAAGLGVAGSYVVMGLFLPLLMARLPGLFPQVTEPVKAKGQTALQTRGSFGDLASRLIVALARRYWLVLPLALAATATTTWLALQLEPGLDPKDFFDHDSDLVVGLDKFTRHAAPALSGEPAVIYIEGDLTSLESLSAIDALLQRLKQNPVVGHTEGGEVSFYSRPVLTLLERVVASDYARAQVRAETDQAITDYDSDGLPDSPAQVRAAYQYVSQHGMPLDSQRLRYDAQQVGETLYFESDNATQSTIISFGIVGSREQARVAAARRSLEQELDLMRAAPGIKFAGLTGAPFTRAATLDATSRALNISLPVAVAGCIVVLALWMRSLSLAIVTAVPICLVVSWMYAFMYLAGFHLNFVTATIGAISTGIGIDYSIYVAQRYRQELARRGNKLAAMQVTIKSAGSALLGAAGTTAVGFGVLILAPMPLFAMYGVLTAVMAVFSLAAALLALPCLLLLAGSKHTARVML